MMNAPHHPRLRRAVRSFLLVLALVLVAAPVACALLPKALRPIPGTRITLLHTNDMHARFEPREQSNGSLNGGILAIDARVREVRAEEARVLLFDSGDVLSGHPVSLFDYQGVTGGALYVMMRLVGYDAMVLGNHDFDNGQRALAGLIDLADFPVLCANVRRTDGTPLHPEVRPWVVLDVNGLRVGVIGTVLEKLAQVTAKKNTRGLEVLPPIDEVRRYVQELDPVTDLIVLLSHQGLDLDLPLGRAVDGLDLILSGHDHRRLGKPIQAGDTLVWESAAHMDGLGRLDLVVHQDAIASCWARVLDLPPPGDGETGTELADLVQQVTADMSVQLDVPIGELKTAWRRSYYGESNLGNWAAEVFRTATESQVAFVNSGSLRKDMSPGTITVGDVLEVMPFQNFLCSFTVTGKELRAICRHNAWAAATQDHGILQVAGVAYTWRQTAPGEVELLTATVNGQPIDDDADYSCVTVDFVVYDQPDKYLGLEPERRERLYMPLQDLLIAAIREQGEVRVATDSRIQQVE